MSDNLWDVQNTNIPPTKDGDPVGNTDPGNTTINIDFSDTSQGPDGFASTFIHEVFHAYEYESFGVGGMTPNGSRFHDVLDKWADAVTSACGCGSECQAEYDDAVKAFPGCWYQSVFAGGGYYGGGSYGGPELLGITPLGTFGLWGDTISDPPPPPPEPPKRIPCSPEHPTWNPETKKCGSSSGLPLAPPPNP